LEEEGCNFYFILIFVAVIMAEKIIYKKRKMGGCTIGYKFARLETQTCFVYWLTQRIKYNTMIESITR
jgi:hypothetical protein